MSIFWNPMEAVDLLEMPLPIITEGTQDMGNGVYWLRAGTPLDEYFAVANDEDAKYLVAEDFYFYSNKPDQAKVVPLITAGYIDIDKAEEAAGLTYTDECIVALEQAGIILAAATIALSETQIQDSVDNWLDEHPEATTTVQDGAITKAKLDENLQGKIDELDDLKSAFDDAFYVGQTNLPLGTAIQGHYMGTDGEPVSGVDKSFYAPVTIDDALVGKTILVSGNLWWSMRPYVFVPTSGSPVYPQQSGTGTIQKEIDLPFVPGTTGTLYINWHNDNPIHSATVEEVIALKEDKLPANTVDVLTGVGSYKKLSFTVSTGYYLNANTGAITTTEGTNANISDYIPVQGGTYYLITTEHFWGQGMFVWYDSGKNYISGVASNNSSTLTKIWNEKVQAPDNAAYLVVAEWVQSNFPPITVYEAVENTISPYLKWSGKKWACVGDSLTERNTRAVMHYYDYVSANTGILPVIMGAGGSGYANNAGGSNAFYNRVSSIPSDADVITLFGSFNDLSSGLQLGTAEDSDTSTIAGCMNKTIENILSVIPTANIGIVAPTPWSGTRPNTNGTSLTYVNMLQAVAERWSLPFLDLWRHSGLMPWDASFAAVAYPSGDTVHPNDIGQQIIAPKFKAFLEALLM